MRWSLCRGRGSRVFGNEGRLGWSKGARESGKGWL